MWPVGSERGIENVQGVEEDLIGDTITAEAEVISVHDTKPVCRLAITVVRQDGEQVLDGEAWCYTFAPPRE